MKINIAFTDILKVYFLSRKLDSIILTFVTTQYRPLSSYKMAMLYVYAK